VGLANPGIWESWLEGKVIQILQNSLTCYNSRAHGHEQPGSFMVSGYYGWLGNDLMMANYYYNLGGAFTKVVIQV
jgi:hypothetical protein